MSVSVLDLIEMEAGQSDPAICGGEVVFRFRSLLSSRASKAADFLSCAQSFEAIGLYDQALAACEEAIRRDGFFWQALLFRAEILLGCFVELDENGSEHNLASKALVDYEQAISLAGRTNGDLVRGLAMALALAGEYVRCLDLVDSTLHDRHSFDEKMESDLLYVQGFSYLFLGAADKARQAFNKMEVLMVAKDYALFGRAVTFLAKGQVEQCVALEKEFDEELRSSLVTLRDTGCAGFLDVARAVA